MSMGNENAFDAVLESFGESSQVKGKRFEEAVKWWLQKDPYWKSVLKPSSVRLWSESEYRDGVDIGIDLTAEGFDGETWAIQAKNWERETAIPKAEIDKFLAASNSVTYQKRLLVTTTNEISANAERTLLKQEKPVVVVKREDLGVSSCWEHFDSGDSVREKINQKQLRPHQVDALNNVVQGFRTQPRGQLIMACGSGKTFTAIRIAEALEAQTVLVLLPSLLLVRQTLNAWYSDSASAFTSIAVCSDPTTADVDKADSTIELPFPTTTRPDQIKAFLTRKGRKVIFSTYDSSERVAEAVPQGVQFDLIICDEAHRLAGLASSSYTTCLDNAKIASKHRLFMTATPRIFSEIVKQKADERANILFSMDDTGVFGSVLHNYSFASAISDKMLTDYQVIVVGVEDQETFEMIDSRALLDVAGEVTDARELAAHVALAKSMEKYDLRRVITYHSRITKASSFATLHPIVLDEMQKKGLRSKEIWTSWITGNHSTFQRQRKIKNLEGLPEGQRGILSNARCLTEGIDVPSLDGIAFVDKRNSTVDIVQAVGRAIRLGPNKKMGYIVVPFMLRKGSSPSEIESSEWAPVWAVLNAMRAHDDRIGEDIDSYRENLGRGNAIGAISDRIVLDMPAGVPETFFGEIREILVSRTGEAWRKNYGRLRRFVEEFGTSDVSSSYQDDEGNLGDWVVSQRIFFKKNDLSPERVKLLEELPGWLWQKKTEWDEQFEMLRVEHELHGVAALRTDFVNKDFRKLGSWIAVQRQRKKKGTISDEQVKALEGLEGWTWDAVASRWFQHFEELRQLSIAAGSADIPAKFVSEKGTRLGQWVGNLRVNYANGQLEKETILLLGSLKGWSWGPRAEAFQKGLASMARYWDRKTGEVLDRNFVDAEGYPLGKFITEQRSQLKKGDLSPSRKAELDAYVGWEQNSQDHQIESYRNALLEFGKIEGHYNVPPNHITASGVWLGLIIYKLLRRDASEKSEYWVNLEKALSSVEGFELPKRVSKEQGLRQKFEERLLQYQQFMQQHGRPPSTHKAISGEEESLANWAETQRIAYKKEQLSETRISALEELSSWVWDVDKAQFMLKLEVYLEWIAEYGTLTVPDKARYKEINLGSWRGTLKASRNKGVLPTWKVELLDSLGKWDT